MVAHLSLSATQDILWLIRDSYFGELCSWNETALRLAALAVMCKENDPTKIIANRVLGLQNFAIEDYWRDEDGEFIKDAYESTGPSRSLIQNTLPDWLNDDTPPILQFIAAGTTGLSDWHFHQADSDYFPSIPHGHWQGYGQPKLDPYTGWIYQDRKQKSREKRNKIVMLWNDKKFRLFARMAVEFYLVAFPHYRGWRVKNPKRLPRRR